MFDFAGRMDAVTKGQLSGMSANDLFQSAIAVAELSNDIDRYEALARLIHAGDEPKLLQRLSELENLHPNKTAQSGIPIQSAPPTHQVR